MAANGPTAAPGRSWPAWRWGLTGLCALGLALSGFLTWHALTGGAMVGCTGGSRCDEVLGSRWSAIAGVLPVSALATGAYLAMLACSFSIGPANAAPVRRLAWDALLVLAGAAAGSAVWFTVVQKWIVRAFCPYCMATHTTGLLLTALVIWRGLWEFGDDRDETAPATRKVRTRRPVLGRIGCGLVLAGLLVAAQVGLAPATVYRGGESQNQVPALDAHAAPLVGSPDAQYVVTLLFDYQCPHCQQLHLMLGEAVRRYEGRLAFVLCPAPLSRRCNPYIPRDVDEFKDSCDLARIALSVWRADPEAFRAFDDWMFSFESGDRWHPRSLAAARARAIEVVGRARFDAVWADPWVDGYLQASVRTFGATMQNGAGGVPKLVFGPRWVTPQPATPADLVSLLHTSLGVPKP